jgi:hypothetical protein
MGGYKRRDNDEWVKQGSIPEPRDRGSPIAREAGSLGGWEAGDSGVPVRLFSLAFGGTEKETNNMRGETEWGCRTPDKTPIPQEPGRLGAWRTSEVVFLGVDVDLEAVLGVGQALHAVHVHLPRGSLR